VPGEADAERVVAQSRPLADEILRFDLAGSSIVTAIGLFEIPSRSVARPTHFRLRRE
jgi:hypothetical protein